MSNLFYGGKDGRSFVIGATFESVGAMLTELAKTTDYIDVNYGDYILITPKNLDHPDNGMLFKRGTDFQSKLDMAYYTEIEIPDETGAIKTFCWKIGDGDEKDSFSPIGDGTRPDANISSYGAVYVGQIAGPGGNAPNVQILSSASQFLKDSNDQLTHLDLDEDGEISTGDIAIKEESGIVLSAAESKKFSIGNKGLVPGKTNSVISYEYCTLRTVDGKCSDVYIGFQVPYPEFEIRSVKTIEPVEDTFFALNKMSTEEDGEGFLIWDKEMGDEFLNPFYYTADVGIQRGRHGDSVSSVQINKEGYLETIYTNKDGLLNPKESNESIPVTTTEWLEDNKTPKTQKVTLKNIPPLNYVTGVSIVEDKDTKEKMVQIHYAYSFINEEGKSTDTVCMSIGGDLQVVDLSKHTYFGPNTEIDEKIASDLPPTGLWFVTKGEE